MTTRDFITQAFNGQTRKTQVSSVFKDRDDNVYSYGYHYPLLFRVKGRAIRNVAGYSSTTNRHIAWSRDVDAIDIHTPYGFRLSSDDELNLQELKRGQLDEWTRLERQLKSKKRKDTQVYRVLERQLAQVREDYKALLDIERGL